MPAAAGRREGTVTAGPRLTRRAVSRLLPSLPLALSACAGSPAARRPGAPYHHTADGFRNPPGSPTRAGAFEDWLGFFWRNMNRDGVVPLPDGHVVPQPEALARLAGETGDSLTWLGHASFLIRLGGRTILTDPFLTPHASPLPPLGPERFAPPGLAPGALPPVDVLLVSHNHYDHLDRPSLEAIPGKAGVQAIVPLGLGSYLRDAGFTRALELDWRQRRPQRPLRPRRGISKRRYSLKASRRRR